MLCYGVLSVLCCLVCWSLGGVTGHSSTCCCYELVIHLLLVGVVHVCVAVHGLSAPALGFALQHTAEIQVFVMHKVRSILTAAQFTASVKSLCEGSLSPESVRLSDVYVMRCQALCFAAGLALVTGIHRVVATA
jgi:hypothetical protein